MINKRRLFLFFLTTIVSAFVGLSIATVELDYREQVRILEDVIQQRDEVINQRDTVITTLQKDLDDQIQETRRVEEEFEAYRERFEGYEALVVEATAYTHTGNATATGVMPQVGVTIAVDPTVIPLGSDIYVEGFGWMKAQDTGGLIKGNIIDIFMDTESEAIQWGRRNIKILVKSS